MTTTRLVARSAIRAVATVAATVALAVAAASTASADPQNANTFPLDVSCSNGEQYAITVVSRSSEQPATHVVDSTSVFVPTTFQFHTLVTADSDGAVLDETSTPVEPVHGASGAHLDTMECTFTQYAHHVWPDVGAVTIEVVGTVEGFLSH